MQNEDEIVDTRYIDPQTEKDLIAEAIERETIVRFSYQGPPTPEDLRQAAFETLEDYERIFHIRSHFAEEERRFRDIANYHPPSKNN
jgi:hypothetical protein